MSKPLDAVSTGRGKGAVRSAPLDAVGSIDKAKASVLDRIAALRPHQDIPADAFTSQEYADRFSTSETTARKELGQLVTDGVLQTALRLSPHNRRMYWPASTETGKAKA